MAELVVNIYTKKGYKQLLKVLKDNYYFCLNNKKSMQWNDSKVSCLVIDNKRKQYHCLNYDMKYNAEILKKTVYYDSEVKKFICNSVENKTENFETTLNNEIIIL